MSARVSAWAWEQELPPQRKLLLLWLATHATGQGVAFPLKAELAAKAGLGERMTRDHLTRPGWPATRRAGPAQELRLSRPTATCV